MTFLSSQLTSLEMDATFTTMVVYFENLLGGGDLGDTINDIISELGMAIFELVGCCYFIGYTAFRLFQSLFVLGNRLPIDCLLRSDDDVTRGAKVESLKSGEKQAHHFCIDKCLRKSLLNVVDTKFDGHRLVCDSND